MSYGERLRDMRAERRLSLRDVAERGGPNKDTMSLIERGVHKPHAQTFARIAHAFDMSVAELRVELEAAVRPKGEARRSSGRPEPVEVQLDLLEAKAEMPAPRVFSVSPSAFVARLRSRGWSEDMVAAAEAALRDSRVA